MVQTKFMYESQTYLEVLELTELLTSPSKAANRVRAYTQDVADRIPADLYNSAITWMEQNFQVFAQETKDRPAWMKRIYCDLGWQVSLRDNTRCINCCNHFSQSLFHLYNMGHCMVVLERVDNGMQVEVMTAAAMMDKYADDIWYINEQSLIHHAEEAEEAAE